MDGINLLKYPNNKYWRSSIAHVPQNIFLTDASIKENIAIGIPIEKIDGDRVRKCSDLAQVSSFVKKLPNKYNSLVLVDHNFRLIYKYNKRKLVPFGEYLPLKDIVSKTGVREIAISREGFIKGTNNPSLKIGNFSILTLICYEIIFPKYIQSDNKDSDIIINISQDAWFGDSFGPHQHFQRLFLER